MWDLSQPSGGAQVSRLKDVLAPGEADTIERIESGDDNMVELVVVIPT